MAVDLEPNTRQTPALKVLDRELVDLAELRNRRLIFCMPPQEGKSERVSRRFPAWLLDYDGSLRIGVVSYEKETAVRWGRVVKRDLQHELLGISLLEDSQAAGRWETFDGGGMYCVGVGGALTGRPIDVLIIDDPFKDRAQAESPVYRQRVWDWWENVGQTRLSPRGIVILILTRWHEDDLGGRLEKAGGWRVVKIPAIAETDNDVLDRKEGEEMISAQGRPKGHFVKLRETLSPYTWLSLYQQRPSPAEGNILRRADFRYWHRMGELFVTDGHTFSLPDCRRFITVDLAASKRTSADWSVASAWALSPFGELLLLDRVRARLGEEDHFDLVQPLRSKWLNPADLVHVEATFHDSTFVYAAGSAGIPIAKLVADTDKITRSLAAANMLKAHRAYFPPADAVPWLKEWEDELAGFPNGAAHDDQVDTFSYAAEVALRDWVSPTAPPRRTTSEGPDFMSIPL
jgi:predicted phage terminase large subunit-like protein